MKLSSRAEAALMNAGTNRQGAKVVADPETMKELKESGLVGTTGLTRSGSIRREALVDKAMKELF